MIVKIHLQQIRQFAGLMDPRGAAVVDLQLLERQDVRVVLADHVGDPLDRMALIDAHAVVNVPRQDPVRPGMGFHELLNYKRLQGRNHSRP